MKAVGPSTGTTSPDMTVGSAVLSAKAALRQQLIAQVRALSPEEREARSARAGANLAAFLEARVPAQSIIALYAATSTEISSDPAVELLRDRYRLAFPRVAGPSLTFHEAPLESLTAHQSRVREPLATDPEVQPDVIVIPARGYDLAGLRLGHGYGYYDRALAALTRPALLVGFCFDFQILESLPRDAHDRWVHWLVSENSPPTRCQNPVTSETMSLQNDPADEAGPNTLTSRAVDP